MRSSAMARPVAEECRPLIETGRPDLEAVVGGGRQPSAEEARGIRAQQRLVDALAQAAGAPLSAIFRCDPETGALVPVTGAGRWYGETDRAAVLGEVLAAVHDVARRCAASAPDVTPTRASSVVRVGSGASVVVVPLEAPSTAGVLVVADAIDRVYTADEIVLIETFGELARALIENARLRSELIDLEASQQRVVESARLRAVGELAAGVAHHLNNIMSVILGNVQLVLRHTRTGEDASSLRAVESAVLEGAELVRRLGSFCRTPPLREHAPLDLNSLVADIVELSRARWEDEAQLRGVRIEARVERGMIPMVSGDSIGLREAVLNLMFNAIEALPADGRIVLKTWSDGPYVYCSVSDNGIGMPADVCERALEPFFTTKGFKSRGLGLSVAYGTIQQHGGSLVVDSVEHEGTTVIFSLPVCSRQTGTAGAASGGCPSLRILLVDDDAAVRAALSRLLRDDGHAVVEAGSGPEALGRLEVDGAFHVVFTDLGMPRMNGWDLTDLIKTRWPSLPVVLVTGWGERPEGLPTDRQSPDSIMAKPITEDALRDALAAIGEGRPPAS